MVERAMKLTELVLLAVVVFLGVGYAHGLRGMGYGKAAAISLGIAFSLATVFAGLCALLATAKMWDDWNKKDWH
jgi:ABC-type Fe3+-siderophore transport system permease subunit